MQFPDRKHDLACTDQASLVSVRHPLLRRGLPRGRRARKPPFPQLLDEPKARASLMSRGYYAFDHVDTLCPTGRRIPHSPTLTPE